MFASLKSNDLLKQVIATQHFAVLATQDNKQPYINLVAFAASDDLSQLLFATDRNTRKYRNIMENEKVALLIDSRRNTQSDLAEALAITALGSACEVKKNDNYKLLENFLQRHRALIEFVEKPITAVMKITVKEYILAGFDKVEKIN